MKFLEEHEFWCQSCGKRQNCPTVPFYFLRLPGMGAFEEVSPIRVCRECSAQYRAQRKRELEVCRTMKRVTKERNDRRSQIRFKERIDRLKVV